MIKQFSTIEIFKVLTIFSENLQSCSTLDELTNEVKNIFEQIYKSDFVEFYMVDIQTNQLKLCYSLGFDDLQKDNHDMSFPEWVVANEKSLLISDVKKSEIKTSEVNQTGSRVYTPIFSNKKCIGAIGLGSKTENYFDLTHVESLNFIGNQIGTVHKSITLQEAKEKSRKIIEILEQDKFRNETILSVLKRTSLDSMVIIERNGIIIDWNPVAEKMFGFSREEVIGENISKTIIPQKHKAAHLKGMENYNNYGLAPVLGKRIEITAIKKSGEEFPVELSINELNHLGEVIFIGFLRDISSRIQFEKRQKTSRDRLVSILQNIGEGVIVADQKQKIIIANPLSEKLMNLTESPVLQQLSSAFEMYDGDRDVLLKSIEGTEMSHQEIVIKGNHAPRILNMTSTRFIDADGISKGYILSLIDITREKEADRLKNEFIGNISHEFRTPLTSIIGFAEIMETDNQISIANVNEFANIIKNEGNRLIDLVENVMLFSKLEGGTIVFNMTKCNLSKLLQKAVSNHHDLLKTKKLKLNFNPNGQEIIFNADADYFIDAISRLIDNAARYSPEHSELNVGYRLTSEGFLVSIGDTGIGMDENEINFLFDKFYRSEKQKRITRGVGLGLPIVKKIIDVHSGTIEVKSTKNAGTEIVLRFKISK